MVAKTTATTEFNLDLNNMVEEAFERCGAELRSGYDMRTARRSLNLLTMEWANRGINLWTIEQGEQQLTPDVGSYDIPVNTVDLLDHVIRTGSDQNQSDLNITRISESTYATIPNKNATGKPVQVWINRQSGNTNVTTALLSTTITSSDTTIVVSDASQLSSSGFIQLDSEVISYQNVSGNSLLNCFRAQNGTAAVGHTAGAVVYVHWLSSIYVWPSPAPPGDQYTFVYWRLRRIQDGGNGVNIQDIPFRFIPCMVAGLAFYLSLKLPEGQMRMQTLKSEYEEQWALASTEDRDKSADRYVPRNMMYA